MKEEAKTVQHSIEDQKTYWNKVTQQMFDKVNLPT
jgi:hypothetical protein